MLSLTSSKALTYNELSSDFSKSALCLLLLITLLAVSVLSSFLIIDLTRGIGFILAGTTFDTITSAGFFEATLLSTGLNWVTTFFDGWFCPPSDVVMAYQIHKIKEEI